MEKDMHTMIKVCGLTEVAQAQYINENKVEFAGFVLFFPKSKRNISIEKAEAIIKALDKTVKKVAVVVSPDEEEIAAINASRFDYIQIHGDIDKRLWEKIELPVLKAFNVDDIKKLDSYRTNDKIKGYVFDAAQPGSGKVFDWNILKSIERDEKLFVLAGGLNALNVEEAVKVIAPDIADVSSGVEYEDKKGKDPDKIRQFVAAVRNI